MGLPKIKNLKLKNLTDDIILVHQVKTPYDYSCCDGLVVLPKEGRNSDVIVLDLNIEPKFSLEIFKAFGHISDYVCCHGDLDHMSHVYGWEAIEATIHAPRPENMYLIDLYNYYNAFNFSEMMEFHVVELYADLCGYISCKKVKPFEPGDMLKFENFRVETISYKGHSEGHVGLYLPEEKILHISSLGFDQPDPKTDGFGPWYGNKESSLEQYKKDIDNAEELFMEEADFLTSSHGYIVEKNDKTPFEYMMRKIEENQKKVNEAALIYNLSPDFDECVEILREQDIFFKKVKMKGVLKLVHILWEHHIITKHLEKIFKCLE